MQDAIRKEVEIGKIFTFNKMLRERIGLALDVQ